MLEVTRRREQGDTIIEVLIAVVVFSLVAVGAIAIMNQGTSTAQRALEISLVRQQLDAQAETLRYLHHAYVSSFEPGVTPDINTPAGAWVAVASKSEGVTRATDFGSTGANCPNVPAHGFVVNAHTARLSTTVPTSMSASGPTAPMPYSQVVYEDSDPTVLRSAQGIWVEAVRSTPNPSQAGYIDFHIRACWDSPGSPVPVTLGTIVRLYEPRGASASVVVTPTPAPTPTPIPIPTPPVAGPATCDSVSRTFAGDISLLTTAGNREYGEAMPGSLQGGCVYTARIGYGDDAHASQRSQCNAGDQGACQTLNQTEEWFYVEGLSASGTVVFKTPSTHTPDVPSTPVRQQHIATVAIPAGQTVVRIRFVHPPIQSPTGRDWIDGNSVHIYSYSFSKA